MGGVKIIEDLRHEKLMELLEPYSKVQEFVDALNGAFSYAQVSQWKNRSKRKDGKVSNINSESARRLEQLTGKPRGWMDTYWPFVSIEPERFERIPLRARGLIEAAMVTEIVAHEERSAKRAAG